MPKQRKQQQKNFSFFFLFWINLKSFLTHKLAMREFQHWQSVLHFFAAAAVAAAQTQYFSSFPPRQLKWNEESKTSSSNSSQFRRLVVFQKKLEIFFIISRSNYRKKNIRQKKISRTEVKLFMLETVFFELLLKMIFFWRWIIHCMMIRWIAQFNIFSFKWRLEKKKIKVKGSIYHKKRSNTHIDAIHPFVLELQEMSNKKKKFFSKKRSFLLH